MNQKMLSYAAKCSIAGAILVALAFGAALAARIPAVQFVFFSFIFYVPLPFIHRLAKPSIAERKREAESLVIEARDPHQNHGQSPSQVSSASRAAELIVHLLVGGFLPIMLILMFIFYGVL